LKAKRVTSPSLLVFICAHNACRSAIAEVIAADEAARRGLTLEVESAGTHALPGYAAASIAQATISEIGLSLEHHRSKPANADLISRATLVVTMTDTQRDMLHTAFPKDRDKVVSFDELTSKGDVPDPIGGDAAEVRAVRDLLQSSMPTIFSELAERVKAGPQPA
jgi:protein-tyrosine-phosphatase